MHDGIPGLGFFYFSIYVWGPSLVLSLGLLLWPRFRKRSNPLAWIAAFNLFCAAALASLIPIANTQEYLFANADPGYSQLPNTFSGRSLYIPDTYFTALGFNRCEDGLATTYCGLPIGALLGTAQLDFIETGVDPIIRWELKTNSTTCTNPPDVFTDESLYRVIWPMFGVCAAGTEVDTPLATHRLDVQLRRLDWPSEQPYYHVTLRDIATDTTISALDGWYKMDEYARAARRFDGPIQALLGATMPKSVPHNTAHISSLIARFGIDEDMILATLNQPYQGFLAEAVWLACRNDVQPLLSAEATAALTAFTSPPNPPLFADSPDWRWPRDCPDWVQPATP